MLHSALLLPDSFGVIHVGETFRAYLGALNTSEEEDVTQLSVKAALQTPTTRHLLPSKLDVEDQLLEIAPGKHLSAIVLKTLEEVGAHVLRVEVKYGNEKSIRKYYRFNVSSPLSIRELTVRGGTDKCFVSIAIENVTATSPLIIDKANFIPPMGLIATRISIGSSNNSNSSIESNTSTAVQRYDASGHLPPKAMFRYLFQVRNPNNSNTKGIAHKDELGKAVFSWKKTMGETGQLASMSVKCPPSFPYTNINPNFIIHGSGISLDVARDASYSTDSNPSNTKSLSNILPITVEPINPPQHLILAQPQTLTLLITNHSKKSKNLQLQFRMHFMSGAVICGPSFLNLGVLKENASKQMNVRIVALVAGLFKCQGCFVVDLDSGLEVPMMSLFQLFVYKHSDDYALNANNDKALENVIKV